MTSQDALDTAQRALSASRTGDVRQDLRAIRRAQNALDAALAERLADLERTAEHELDGASSVTTWARARLGLPLGRTRQLLAAARTVADLPSMGEAARRGRIGLDHTALFTYGLRHLGTDVMAPASPWLLDVATSGEPRDLRQVVRALREAVYPDALDEAWVRGMDKQDVQVNPLPDGWHLTGFLGTVTGAKLSAVLASLGAPRDADDTRTGAERRVDALDTLLTRTLDHGLPTDKGIRPQLTVLAPLEAVQEAVRVATEAFTPTRPGPAADLLGFGAVGPRLLGYLSCGSDVTGVLVRTADAPVADVLNVGRTHRLATVRQRTAVHARQHGECAVPGCRSPILEIHHTTWWSRGGRTDLDHLIGLCPRCHTLVHRERLTVTALGRGRFTITTTDGRALPDPAPSGHTARRQIGHLRQISREIRRRQDTRRHVVLRT